MDVHEFGSELKAHPRQRSTRIGLFPTINVVEGKGGGNGAIGGIPGNVLLAFAAD
jgi:hypothetical protein